MLDAWARRTRGVPMWRNNCQRLCPPYENMSRQIERLMEDHGVDIGFAARRSRDPFELIQPLFVNEDRQVGEAAVGARDRELATVGLANAVGDVELDLVALGQGLHR